MLTKLLRWMHVEGNDEASVMPTNCSNVLTVVASRALAMLSIAVGGCTICSICEWIADNTCPGTATLCCGHVRKYGWLWFTTHILMLLKLKSGSEVLIILKTPKYLSSLVFFMPVSSFLLKISPLFPSAINSIPIFVAPGSTNEAACLMTEARAAGTVVLYSERTAIILQIEWPPLLNTLSKYD